MESVGDVVRNSSGDPFTIWLDTISMGLAINVGVESDDSGVIDELLKVSNLSSVVWATCTKSLDLSLEVTNSLSS